MNYLMVRRLILKDWYLNRWIILGSIPVGLAALALILTGSKAAFLLSIIVLCIVLIGVGAQLAMVTAVNERREQTLAFIMSLPVSWREYTAAKILANLLLFLIPWMALTLAALAFLLFVPGMPHGFVPFTTIMAVEILVTACLTIAAAIITESQVWASIVITCSSLGLNGFGYLFAHMRGISPEMWGQRMHWTSTASTVLVAEFLVCALLLGLTFFVQSRKTDFL
jgi:ABC-2 type transport system permease protein